LSLLRVSRHRIASRELNPRTPAQETLRSEKRVGVLAARPASLAWQ
jgi:hypothetical protein